MDKIEAPREGWDWQYYDYFNWLAYQQAMLEAGININGEEND